MLILILDRFILTNRIKWRFKFFWGFKLFGVVLTNKSIVEKDEAICFFQLLGEIFQYRNFPILRRTKTKTITMQRMKFQTPQLYHHKTIILRKYFINYNLLFTI